MKVGKEIATIIASLMLFRINKNVFLKHQEVEHLVEHRHQSLIRVSHLVLCLLCINLKWFNSLPKLANLIINLTQVRLKVFLKHF